MGRRCSQPSMNQCLSTLAAMPYLYWPKQRWHGVQQERWLPRRCPTKWHACTLGYAWRRTRRKLPGIEEKYVLATSHKISKRGRNGKSTSAYKTRGLRNSHFPKPSMLLCITSALLRGIIRMSATPTSARQPWICAGARLRLQLVIMWARAGPAHAIQFYAFINHMWVCSNGFM